MKKIGFLLIFLMFCLLFSFGVGSKEVTEDKIVQEENSFSTIRLSAMGGTGATFPINLESMLQNPAGLSAKIRKREKSFTIHVYGETYFRPQYIVPILEGITTSKNDAQTILINAKELISSSGAGTATTFGIGFTPVNHTFGFGIYGGMLAYLRGKPFPLGTEGYIQLSMNLPLAYSFPLFSDAKEALHFGIETHPGIMIFKNLNGSDVDGLTGGTVTVKDLIADVIQHPYYATPFDFGLIYSLLDFPYDFSEIRFSFVVKNLFGNYFGPGIEIQKIKSKTLVTSGLGLILPFDLFSLHNSFLLTAEVSGINQIIIENSDFWKSLRLGAELDIGNTLFIRGGLTSGYPSIGLELRLLFASFGFSWQTIEKGLYIGDNPISIFRISIAIK